MGNDVGNNNDSSLQLASQYGISERDINDQIRVIMRRQNSDRLIIQRTYKDRREQALALANLPKTDK